MAIRPIKVAQISEGQALIDSGLQANEQVVGRAGREIADSCGWSLCTG